MSWRDEAACRGMDTRIFFPETSRARAEALEACAACSVRSECRAAGTTEVAGIWGGQARGVEAHGTRLIRCVECGTEFAVSAYRHVAAHCSPACQQAALDKYVRRAS